MGNKWLLKLVLGMSLAGQGLSFDHDDLLNMAASNGHDSVAEFVGDLPVDLRENYVLMGESLSLQVTTPGHPRVLLFSPESGLMLAFTGNGDRKGGDRIEAIQYDPLQQRFLFTEIAFATGRTPQIHRDPEVCQSCHGAEPTPIWESYPAWPGVLPSSDGLFRSEWEEGLYEAFLQNSSTGAYAHLPEPDNYVVARTPVALSNFLAAQQAQFFADKIRRTTYFGDYELAFQGVLSSCDWQEFMPAEWWEDLPFSEQAKRASSVTALEEFHYIHADRLSFYSGGDLIAATTDFMNLERIVGLRVLLERDGAKISPWYFGRMDESYSRMRGSLYNRILAALDLERDCSGAAVSRERLQQLMARSPDFLRTGLSPWPEQKRYRDLLGDFDVYKSFAIVSQSCASCHVGNDPMESNAVPEIPFHSPEDFMAYLKRDGYLLKMKDRLNAADPARIMPPNRTLSDNTKSLFIQALEALASETHRQ